MPVTRVALLADNVRHQVVLEEDGTIDLETDPEAHLLIQLQQSNNLCCFILNSNGFDGYKLKLNAPRVVK